MRLLLVDDHAVVRRGLRDILEEAVDGIEVSEAEDGDQALRRLREESFDVMILDITLPGRSGLEVLKRVKAEWPQLKVIVLSIYPEEQYGVRTLKAGAAAYLTKATAPDNLIEALKRVMSGHQYVTPTLAERLVHELTHDSPEEPHHALSDREYEIFRMLASGKRVSDIAKELVISVKTVSTHRTRILEKMQMQSNAELTHYAIKRGLVD